MIKIKNLINSVSIGITTKNRWQNLYLTLKKIVDAGLETLPVVVYDDYSDQLCPFDMSALGLKNYQYKRANESKGYIVRRDELAKLMNTKYYLSLDDDSYPVSSSLSAAIEFAEACPDLFCLSFPVYNPILGEYQNCSLHGKPYKVRFFIGCGHLLHLERFLKFGGYREELIHQGEEMDVAARAFQQGWYCYHFPDFVIHHVASDTARNWQRMDFYGSRNTVLWNDWYVPKELKWMKQSRTLISRILLMLRIRRYGMIRGEIAGIRAISRYKSSRAEMSLSNYRIWQNLPAS